MVNSLTNFKRVRRQEDRPSFMHYLRNFLEIETLKQEVEELDTQDKWLFLPCSHCKLKILHRLQ